MDGVSVLALILIVSFVIDRMVTGLLFLLSFANVAPDVESISDPFERNRAKRRNKVLYFSLAGILAILVLAGHRELRILEALGVGAGEPIIPGLGFWNAELLDALVTGIALVGGAERIAELQGMAGKSTEAEKEAPPPIEVTGTLTVAEGAQKKTAGQ